jgi:hypothetical protein
MPTGTIFSKSRQSHGLSEEPTFLYDLHYIHTYLPTKVMVYAAHQAPAAFLICFIVNKNISHSHN